MVVALMILPEEVALAATAAAALLPRIVKLVQERQALQTLAVVLAQAVIMQLTA